MSASKRVMNMMNTNDEVELLKMIFVDHELESEDIINHFLKLKYSVFTFFKAVITLSSSDIDVVGCNT